MKRQYLVVGIVVLLCGCGAPKPVAKPFFGNDDSGLPKFKLIQVLDGTLVQLSESGTVLYEPRSRPGYHGNEISATSQSNLVSFRDLHYSTATPQLCSFREGKIETVPGNSFVDSSGKIHPYLVDRPISVSESGKKIGLLPIRVPSDHFRYYSGINCIYASDIKTGEMMKIWDRPLGSNIKNFDDILYMGEQFPDISTRIVRFGPHQTSQSIYQTPHGYLVYVTDRSGDGTIAIRDASQMHLQNELGKQESIESANLDLHFMNYRGRKYVLGFAVSKDANGLEKNNTPAIWNRDKKPVPFSKLCPELMSKVVRISSMQTAKILANRSGLVAIEMSGYNLGPGNSSGIPESDGDYVFKTYVLQVIDEPES